MSFELMKDLDSRDPNNIRDYLGQRSYDLNLKWDLVLPKIKNLMESGNELSLTDFLHYLAEECAFLGIYHPDWSLLSGRVELDSIKIVSCQTLLSVVERCRTLLHQKYYDFIKNNHQQLEKFIDYSRDDRLDWFAIKTLQRSYLLKSKDGKGKYKPTAETPQHLYMRVAVWLWFPEITKIREVYNDLSSGYYTHASPTLFNSGCRTPTLSSCFLLSIKDSLTSIAKGWHDCAMISKNSGGIGLDISDIRHSEIGETGWSAGIVPMLQVYDKILNYVDQCFPPSTLIYTIQGPKPIGKVAMGDQVLGNDGKFRRVKRVLHHHLKLENKSPQYLKIYTSNFGSVEVTGEHQILALEVRERTSNKLVVKNLENGRWVPSYFNARDLTPQHLILYPIPQYENDIPSFTETDAWVYGVMLMGGFFMKEGYIETIFLKNSPAFQPFLGWLEQTNNLPSHTIDFGSYYSIRFPHHHYFPITPEMIDNKDRTINRAVLHLPLPKIKELLRGMVDVGGIRKGDRVQLFVRTKKMVQSVNYLLLRLGIAMSGKPFKNEEGEIHYAINFEWSADQTYCDYVFSRVKRVWEYEGSEATPSQLIDLEVDTSHDHQQNYVVCGLGVVHNGGKRKGSGTIYLPDYHIDILDFFELRKNTGSESRRARDLFYAMWTSDLFMERVKDDQVWSLFCPNKAKRLNDVWGLEFKVLYEKYEREKRYTKQLPAREVWKALIIAQQETGMPFMLYKDSVNRKNNQANLGTIRCSNLCVSGDTKILTDLGHITISDLKDQIVNVWNGQEWSETVIRQTSEHQDLLKVELSNGVTINCTSYHKFPIKDDNDSRSQEYEEIEAHELEKDDILLKWKLPDVIKYEVNEEFPHAYTHGFFCGDGTTYWNYSKTKKYPKVFLYSDKKRVLLEHLAKEYVNESCGKITVILSKNLKPKYEVPLRASIDNRLRWLEGFCDADACVLKTGNALNIQFASIKLSFMRNIRLLLQTLGVEITIKKCRENGFMMMPDGKGGMKNYKSSEMWRANIKASDLWHLKQLGFAPKRLNISNLKKPKTSFGRYVRVEKVTSGLKDQETFCFTEPKRHMGLFNGVQLINCTEICEFTSEKDIANCNLSSVGLDACVQPLIGEINLDEKSPERVFQGKHCGTEYFFDFKMLEDLTRKMTQNLNQVIDRNYYPPEVPAIKSTNLRDRPLGMGVQGMADCFAKLDLCWDSQTARDLNKYIFETMYYAYVSESCEMARKLRIKRFGEIRKLDNGTKHAMMEKNHDKLERIREKLKTIPQYGYYDSFKGSPLSKGLFQFDLWAKEQFIDKGVKESDLTPNFLEECKMVKYTTERYDWTSLRKKVVRSGVRNSLGIALMPTASSAQINCRNESFEMFTSNLYARTVLSGSFVVVNRWMVEDLEEIGLWNDEIIEMLNRDSGSLQNLTPLPSLDQKTKDRIEYLKRKYKTVWEFPQRTLLDMSADRGVFVCQSQSMNCFMENPTYQKLSAYHFYAWDLHVKTGMYYARSRTKAKPINFALSSGEKRNENKKMVCTDEVCVMCSS